MKHNLDLTNENIEKEYSKEELMEFYTNVNKQLNACIEQTQDTINKLEEAFKSICTIQYSGILSKMDYLTGISVPTSADIKLNNLAKRIKVLEDIIKSNNLNY